MALSLRPSLASVNGRVGKQICICNPYAKYPGARPPFSPENGPCLSPVESMLTNLPRRKSSIPRTSAKTRVG